MKIEAEHVSKKRPKAAPMALPMYGSGSFETLAAARLCAYSIICRLTIGPISCDMSPTI